MATKFTVKCSWADMEDEECSIASNATPSTPLTPSVCSPVKFSYACIASKGVKCSEVESVVETMHASSEVESESVDDNASDFSDFTLVRKKRSNKQDITKQDMTKRCESAVLQWAKNKSQEKRSCTDEEISCTRCGIPFLFSTKTKQKYAEKGWKTPKICKVCCQLRYEDRKNQCC